MPHVSVNNNFLPVKLLILNPKLFQILVSQKFIYHLRRQNALPGQTSLFCFRTHSISCTHLLKVSLQGLKGGRALFTPINQLLCPFLDAGHIGTIKASCGRDNLLREMFGKGIASGGGKTSLSSRVG